MKVVVLHLSIRAGFFSLVKAVGSRVKTWFSFVKVDSLLNNFKKKTFLSVKPSYFQVGTSYPLVKSMFYRLKTWFRVKYKIDNSLKILSSENSEICKNVEYFYKRGKNKK